MRALAPPVPGLTGLTPTANTEHKGSSGVARRSVVIVGGGVTGLTAAHAIHRARPDAEIRLFEARDRLGGNIVTDREDGFVIDGGPDSFIRTKPDALDLCRELGLEAELVGTREVARHVFVAHRGKLERMPGGMALAVPTQLRPLLDTPLLSPLGKLRLLVEPLVPRTRTHEDESMESFFVRRLGREGAQVLAGPLLGGIYAGDFSKLSIQATFPQLVDLEQRYGSLIRGFLALELSRGRKEPLHPHLRDVYTWLRRKGDARAPSPFVSLRGGMGTLIDALASTLPAGAVRTGAPVTGIQRQDGHFRIDVAAESFVADSVVLAAPAHVAARLVPDVELSRELAAIPYVSSATVFFALDQSSVIHDLQGFGFIVPPGEADLLASTWVSSKWEGRAPSGGALVRAFVGGARDPGRVKGSTDDELVTFARAELERLMGPLGAARFTRVYRYTDAGPQPHVGHRARLERIAAHMRALPGLHVAGAAYEGVGIPDCVRQARAVSSAVLRSMDEPRRAEKT